MKKVLMLMAIAMIGLMVSCKETTTKSTDVTVTDTTVVESDSVSVLNDTVVDEDVPASNLDTTVKVK